MQVTASVALLLLVILLLGHIFHLISVGKILWSMHACENFPVDYHLLISRQAFLVSALSTAFFILQVY